MMEADRLGPRNEERGSLSGSATRLGGGLVTQQEH